MGKNLKQALSTPGLGLESEPLEQPCSSLPTLLVITHGDSPSIWILKEANAWQPEKAQRLSPLVQPSP